MTEQWRPVVGYEGAYEVSSLGRVRSLDRYVRHPLSQRPRLYKGKVLAGSDSKGYRQVWLGGGACGKPSKMAKVYRLVAEAFLGPAPSPKHSVNHINGIKSDDRPENLEWVTHAENMAHAGETGLMAQGEASPNSKTTSDDVRQMRQMRREGARLRAIADKFGMSVPTVCQIVNGTWWKHAPLADQPLPPADEWRRGEMSHSAKLTESDVIEIRELYATGQYTQKQIGEMFGVTSVSISSAIRGKTWGHIRERGAEGHD